MDHNETLTINPRGLGAALPVQAALVCIEAQSAQRVRLPESGALLIGRAPEAAVRLADPTASRRHARLQIDAGEAQVIDLGSHNGTKVNGQTLRAPRLLRDGDIITICDAVLIYKREALAPLRTVVDDLQLRERLIEDVLRARTYQRRLLLLALRPGGFWTRPQVASLLSGRLRAVDGVAFSPSDELMILCPDLADDDPADLTEEILRPLREALPNLSVGVACCPEDGVEADALIAAVQQALQSAPPGELRRAGRLGRVRKVGDADLLLQDEAMVRLYDLIERLAPSDLPVLVCGETGCGKELAAGALHHWSGRRGPLLSVNCAALTESLAESELFGHERGAFSGAVTARQGYFEAASGGTLFLDEIGELPLPLQAKLLRVLETMRVTRLGATQERPIQVRLVAATNRDLEAEVTAGRFRRDLYFRLSAATVQLLPLRERRCEIEPLARTFLSRACERAGRAAPDLSSEVLHALVSHDWPGNLRELRNLMALLSATVPGPVVLRCHLPPRLRDAGQVAPPVDQAPPAPAAPAASLEAAPAAAPPEADGDGPQIFRPLEEELAELEQRRITEALEAAGGVHYRAAELIAMPLRTFANKVKRYGLSKHRG